ncbi:DNA-directed DNA polymerase alpha catalytic subunit pol1 [Marasmius crinis-equi]|uniref:DNA polymerase n=1 Tax=Marasmius crinis-equi TaxID=585013 RepID=A0ABR3FVF0_9AGAR
MSSRVDKKSKLAALADLKRSRQGVARTFKSSAKPLQEEDVTLYDEVDEDQYKRVVKGRLQKDDFVVDDGVDGYMDNGMDDWMEGDEEYPDSEEEAGKKKSSKKSTKTSTATGKGKGKPKAPPQPTVAPTINDYRKAVSAEEESDFMANLFNTMDSAPTKPPTTTAKSRKRKNSPDYDRDSSPVPYRNGGYDSYADASSDGPIDDYMSAPSSDDLILSPKKKQRTDTGGPTLAAHRLAQMEMENKSDDAEFDEVFEDIDMSFLTDEDLGNKPTVKTEKMDVELPPAKSKAEEKENALPSWLSVYDSLTVASADSLGSTVPVASAATASNISALEADGSLHFFWIDYLEHEGQISFIGKVKDKTSGAWISACVTVENLERNLFVLPRAKRVEEGEDGKYYDTDEVPSPTDVYGDFDAIRRKSGIGKFKGKFVERMYAFGESDVPREKTSWLKVAYPFSEPQLPSNIQSPNIARVFGTNTSSFELLVLKRRIKGPCWIKIGKPEVNFKGVSWCKFEATVSDPKDFNPFSDKDNKAPTEVPPLTAISLSVRTVVNHKDNRREVMFMILNAIQVVIDDPTPPDRLPCTVQTFVRPLGDKFPSNFEAHAKANGKALVSCMKNERMLLSSLLAALHKADPDIIVGHDFLGVSLDVLLHRLRDLKVDHWSRLGRFRRKRWPNIGKQGTNIKFLTGRLMCDLTSDGAKSMISSTTWSLTEMCKTHLKRERQEIDPDDFPNYFDSSLSGPEKLMTFVRHCELDAHYHMALASNVQIIPLTKELTNIAGNAWNKTLNGGRAERNEYILLHEFHRLKYICPDKEKAWAKKAAKPEPVDDDPEAQKDAPKGKKKDKYKGGLVFEPKRGLWDKYILVMDFNSLYPSIIQEYNIDFTTIESIPDAEDENGEQIQPDPPGSEVGQGVLPRLISTLVKRRRAVKSLMKDKTATTTQLLQWDITQLALKLTANSMYGCLGFEYSRFFARHLASLTTYKGREILTHTRELAESMNLDVVYGDTDSVFVNSNVTELSEALKISSEFKKAVNECYKLLEIDLDGVFQRLLLLQKKKYAAIKMEDGTKTSTEVKGLDMKRREYCELSKNVSHGNRYVLTKILSGEPTEIVIEQIHEYLTTVGENVRGGHIKLDDFTIHKRLGKDPEAYPKAEGQPHVQVALKMKAKGGNARAGDVIPYIFCLPEGAETAKTAQSERAHHRDELRKADSELKIDYEYYLSQQVLPPIERLCEPIEGTDRARLAECLGLDPARYRVTVSSSAEENGFASLDSQLSDAQRFKDAESFYVRCRDCNGEWNFAPLSDRDNCCLAPGGRFCPACQKPLQQGSLQAQLECQIRRHIARFYECWTVCTDQTCSNRTRMMGVYGRRCLRPGCQATVAFEYSDEKLYNQLRYFSYLFDGQRAIKNAVGSDSLEAVTALANAHSGFLSAMSGSVEKYLEQCGRRWVELSSLFSFMKV